MRNLAQLWRRRLRLSARILSKRRLLLGNLLALSLCCWLAVAQLGPYIKVAFLNNNLEPEPRLSPREARAVAKEFALPAEAATVPVVERVHFMYRSYSLDAQLRPFLASWRKTYPNYKMYFWTDKEIEALLHHRYPDWQDLYHRQLSNYLERSDMARVLVLHAMGGWYADVDAASLKSAETVASGHALILPLEPYVHAMENFNKFRLASNAIMYSSKGHPFWMYFLRRLAKSLIGRPPRSSTLEAAFVTGPAPLTEAALLFIQAHTGSDCPGVWCPHLPQPVQFMPVYDDHTPHMRSQLTLRCEYSRRQRPDFIEFARDCLRYRGQDYRNRAHANESFAFHAFLHLNERSPGMAQLFESDVRNWGLGFVTGDAILADVA